MQLFYGPYPFDINATLLSTETHAKENAAGRQYALVQRVTCHGYLSSTSVTPQNDLTQKESQLKTVLAVQFRDLKFFCDDGSPSSIGLLNAGSINGVRIVDGPHFKTTHGPEYASIRTFDFVAEAEYPMANTQNILLSFTEKLEFSGGFPLLTFRNAVNTLPQKQLVYPSTPFEVIQSGEAEGYRQMPVAPPSKWPAALMEAPRIVPVTPKRRGPNTYECYALSWWYRHMSATPLLGTPTLWTG